LSIPSFIQVYFLSTSNSQRTT